MDHAWKSADQLVGLKDDIVDRGSHVEAAQENARRLMDIRDDLADLGRRLRRRRCQLRPLRGAQERDQRERPQA